MRKALELLEGQQKAEEDMKQKQRDLKITEDRMANAETAQRQVEQKVAHLTEKLKKAESTGALGRLVRGLNPQRITKAIEIAEQRIVQLKKGREQQQPSFYKVKDEVVKFSNLINDIAAQLKAHPHVENYRKEIENTERKIADLQTKIAEVDAQLSAMREKLINNCRVLATTAYQVYLSKEIKRMFDVAIIDEASMLIFPLTFYASGLAQKAIVVAGDFRQLPPIVLSNEQLVQEWLRKDAFVMAGIADAIEARKELPHVYPLQTQFRMRTDICDCINKFFYSDRPLKSDAEAASRSSDMPLAEESLLYVDTATFHPWASYRLGSYSRYNIFHALLIRNIVTFLTEKGYVPEDAAQKHVGIVSPYSAQTKLIAALLEDKLGHPINFVATVHRFQSNEKDTMIVDLTESPVVRLGKFLSATHRMEEGARLLNVALSRARCHIILVANFEHLRRVCGDNMITSQLLDHFEEHGKPLQINELLPIGDKDWTDALDNLTGTKIAFDLTCPGAFNAGTFQIAFSSDLRTAKKSIIIFSPFLTKRGVSKWMDALQLVKRNGVNVRVVTRPPGDQGGILDEDASDLVGALRGCGFSVDLRSRMHEKLAVIDGHVLWHGSLNILSHRDTSETMLRLLGKKSCSEVARIVSTPFGSSDGKNDIGISENPTCKSCGGHMIWNNGRYGIYFECENCGEKINMRQVAMEQSGKDKEDGIDFDEIESHLCPMPDCEGTMRPRRGRYGSFFGCSNYRSGCRHTEKITTPKGNRVAVLNKDAAPLPNRMGRELPGERNAGTDRRERRQPHRRPLQAAERGSDGVP